MGDWHEEYRRRYARLKEAGKPFFPYAVFKDVVVAFLVLCLLGVLAWYIGSPLEDLADPTDTTYNPRPEWYFLFLFEALKFVPGRLEAIAAVLLPAVAILCLLLVPMLDRGPTRHPLDRPLWTGCGLVALLVVIWLTWRGARSPLINPVIERDPLVLAGQRLYRELRCASCHMIKGAGGLVGPELDKVVGNKTAEWLSAHFRDPQAVTPGSVMPQFHLLEDEIQALVAYMQSLAIQPFTEEAPRLFATHCAACHRIGSEGGDLGPDLSRIGSARDNAYLRAYIEDPSRINPDSVMPSYTGQLTDVQIEELSRYLASLVGDQ